MGRLIGAAHLGRSIVSWFQLLCLCFSDSSFLLQIQRNVIINSAHEEMEKIQHKL